MLTTYGMLTNPFKDIGTLEDVISIAVKQYHVNYHVNSK